MKAALAAEVFLGLIQAYGAIQRMRDPAGGNPLVRQIMNDFDAGSINEREAAERMMVAVRDDLGDAMDEFRSLAPDKE